MGIDIVEVIEAAKTKPFRYMSFHPGPGSKIQRRHSTHRTRRENNSEMPQYVARSIEKILGQQRGRNLSHAHILIVGIVA